MRKSSCISKRLSDSVLGLALLTVPLSLPGPAIDDVLEAVAPQAAVSETALGRFLETEIEGRMEKVSGHSIEKSELRARSHEIAVAVAEASYLHEVDPFLLLSMIEVESRYNSNAKGLHGEIGLMQMKPTTARWIAPVTDQLYDCDLHGIRCNVMMGATYVSHIQRVTKARDEQHESFQLFRAHVLRSYNLGPAKANRLEFERAPASDGDPVPYAVKIAWRADRMHSRYLAAAIVIAKNH